MITGVYILKNLANGKLYVGSSIDVFRRFKEHLIGLRDGHHENIHLQRAWNRYGSECFSFRLMRKCTIGALLFVEQELIDSYEKSVLYNISPTASSCLGVKHTVDTRKKMSAAKKGKPSSFLGKKHKRTTKQKIRKIKLGKSLSREHAMKIGEAHRGMKRSVEAKEKLRKAQLGKKHSKEAINKMRTSKLGRTWKNVDGKRIWSEKCQH